MATKNTAQAQPVQQERLSPEDYNKLQMEARSIVSNELKKHGIEIDVRLLTTISILTNTTIKYLQQSLNPTEAREAFDKAMTMYLGNNTVPF